MPRLGHKKSRNGCRQCKARHVKCDEAKPCGNCARHRVACSLVTWDPNDPVSLPSEKPPADTIRAPKSEKPRKSSATPSQSSAAAPTPASLPIEYVLNPSPGPGAALSSGSSPSSPDPFPFLSKLANKSDTIQPNYWVRDLELMHHWTTVTYKTLSDRETVQDLWQLTAPKQAIVNPFLMHEILAYSSFHMAYSFPEQRRAYYALGTHHQDLAVRAMRKTLPHISADNAPALFTVSALLALSSFGSHSLEVSNSVSPIDDLLDIYALAQGVYHIFSKASHLLSSGPFASLVADLPYETPQVPLLYEIAAHLDDIIATMAANSDALTEEVRVECTEAITIFKECIGWASRPNSDNRALRIVFLFPTRASSAMLNLMRQNEPVALGILAHYCVVLKSAEPRHWFMLGWARRVVRAIDEVLEPKWKDLIRWPLEMAEAQAGENAAPPP